MGIRIFIVTVQQQKQCDHIFVLVKRAEKRLQNIVNHRLVEIALGQRLHIQGFKALDRLVEIGGDVADNGWRRSGLLCRTINVHIIHTVLEQPADILKLQLSSLG
ncbi:hypothetical protein D3C71_1414060 [compost metagenome]